ncbi:hypothetical protein Goe20_01940 [Bacillus phage vB_BsuM-Goe20]|nr:hypothetical protein Goe17_01970 [Bacillus phage vB_BsuM-Goe17]WCS69311.1 hypothetical protein Goe20_01940 [Bacillus phage vB_BsuM-Goe20]
MTKLNEDVLMCLMLMQANEYAEGMYGELEEDEELFQQLNEKLLDMECEDPEDEDELSSLEQVASKQGGALLEKYKQKAREFLKDK